MELTEYTYTPVSETIEKGGILARGKQLNTEEKKR